MADTSESQEDLAALDSRSSTTRQKRPYRRWSDEEKETLVFRKDIELLSWKELIKKYYPNSRADNLQQIYRKFKEKQLEMSVNVQTKQATLPENPISFPLKRTHDVEAASDCSSSGDDIPHHLEQVSSPTKKLRVHNLQVSRDPRRRPARPSDQPRKTPQNENGPTITQRGAETPVRVTSPKASDASVKNQLQVNQENSNNWRVQATGSPKKSQNVQKGIEIHVSPELHQQMSQLLIQASIEQRNILLEEMSQMKLDLTSARDQLRVSEEKRVGFEAENLRLKTELECVQANEKSLDGELKNKRDELEHVKSNILKCLGHRV